MLHVFDQVLCDYCKSQLTVAGSNGDAVFGGCLPAYDWLYKLGAKMSTISAVDGLLAQMRVAAAAAGLREPAPVAAPTVNFSSVLKNALDGVAQAQDKSETLQKAFVMGDDKVSLSDTMIAMQKAGINFQATVQVRNKVIQAYNDIMNMQV